MSNARLIDALDASRRELAERADVERSLREIAARISAATDLPAVLQLGVDEAARLLHADGARIDLIDPDLGLLRWAYASGAVEPSDEDWPDDPDETARPGHLRPGGRHRPGVLVRRLPQRHALPARPRGGPVRRRVRAPFGHGRAVERRGRPDRGADRLQQPRRRSGARRTARCSRRSPIRPRSRSARPA